MTTLATEPVIAGASTDTVDERIVHRGPLRRLLVSPEVGALFGAVLVWAFFWGVADTFGRASTTLNWLDAAAPLGIMAVAVALLMIGGEFDLSAGVMTGAAAIQVGLMGRYFMGEGIEMWKVVLAAFATAAALGWFNGTLVNRTGLPSFIVTLASFFVLRGITLVLSKRFEGKVQVDQIDEVKGYAGFFNWFAHEWKFTNFGWRDELFLAAVVIGVAAVIVGLLEQSLVRNSTVNPAGLAPAVVGAALAVFGFLRLHATDGVGANTLWSLVAAIGVIMFVLGVALTRYLRSTAVPGEPLSLRVFERAGFGVLLVVMACLVPIPFDRNEGRPILTWISSGFRPVVAVVAALLGLGLVLRRRLRALRERLTVGGVLTTAFLSLYAAGLTMAGTLTLLQLSTVQAFRAMSMLLLAGGGFVLLLTARGQAAARGRAAQAIIGFVAAALLVVVAFVVRYDSSAERFRSGLFAALLLGAVFLVVNTLVEVLFLKRTSGHAADRTGRMLVAVGLVVAVIGLVVRVAWSNFTAEQAAALKAAGEPVPVSVLRQTVVWWVLVTLIAAFILARTKFGNWIFAVGGNKDAARAIGVPAAQVKTGLFVMVSMMACFAGLLIALRYKTVQANQGFGEEFEYIIAAVVGGCLLTGGYGSVIGATLGASIMAMSNNGISTSDWNSDGRFAFLGVVLLTAVLVNNYTRKKAQEAR
jgi:ribose/xylose/arabinose/galactoside ABC-type transport system permease subunit